MKLEKTEGERYRLKQECFEYWLYSVPGLGDRSIEKLLKLYGSAESVYRGDPALAKGILKPAQQESMEERRKNWDLAGEIKRLEEKGIWFLSRNTESYPNRLREIPDSPFGIFCRGKLPVEDTLSVAVVGARECSEYGRFIARELGAYLGKNGVQVVSGMACGIDSISQEAALEAGGSSTAVLGSGVDVCYPLRNRRLYECILESGCVISAYPPGTPPRAGQFPPRNRIVSGLADVLVVVEAREKSGTLITVDMALEQGKEIYVVPGRITDRLSDGCNRLIRQGAGVLLNPADFLQEIRELFSRQGGKPLQEKPAEYMEHRRESLTLSGLPKELAMVLETLDCMPRSTQQILLAIGGKTEIAKLQVWLMELCLMGLAVQETPGFFRQNCR